MARPKAHQPEKILRAAIRVFTSEGVSASTARIASEAGVSNGSLFNYFPTKQALIDALYVSLKADLALALGDFEHDSPVEQRLRQIWDRWLHWAGANRKSHQVMTLLHEAGLASEGAQAEGVALLDGPMMAMIDAMESGLLVELPLDYLGALIQQQLHQAVLSELDPAQADLAFTVMWNGITRSHLPIPPTTKALS